MSPALRKQTGLHLLELAGADQTGAGTELADAELAGVDLAAAITLLRR